MKLVTYRHHDVTSIGKVVGNQVLDLPTSDAHLPSTMMEFLAGGQEALARAKAVLPGPATTYSLADVELLAPVPNPGKFLAIGLNYRKHVEEAVRAGMKIPEVQIWFNKQITCVNSPTGDVHMPRVSDQLDYEVELCVVIGQRCRHVSAANARQVIAGYMVCNDVTVRDWQMRSPTMTMGKSFDTTGPIGPWIVTDDEVPDPQALNMRLYVNGELRQEETTAGMVYDIYQQIEHLSAAFTLEPGDLIATGTPSGVGIAMQPARFLKVGDVMRAEIDGIGHIENRVVAEPVKS
ncbi:fumarylacetoacetate hydrolase family protein [Glaciimonas immobilis]|uniref:2-keto-4-pentenoate hydratase/2-oxohepta-3-ene-1,7-dioic acid hydratase in catechol pathway n=1 Tax=Glaciimonas immobilis TaxID=728004 RepID=A0A840RR82_9BURK|nr:fumarylacetoacetate hydrolase family protein [Glaciimonas immobilis]KAF3998184.1 fumarylacetoacetate hydrolase family protein [Glaciimonas immobilis]MBB5199100.1 2-keto-4-pentenoate hydratase/2-oxohepta-3-ene-1,7-dioic acid hydratase in catechol pathway [Glaciimonas immobilis]